MVAKGERRKEEGEEGHHYYHTTHHYLYTTPLVLVHVVVPVGKVNTNFHVPIKEIDPQTTISN